MKSTLIKILCFFGTRPEAIKMAPVVQELGKDRRFETKVAVSAQHREMLDQVLGLFHLKSDMDMDLMKEGQSLTDVTARVIKNFEPALERFKPDLVLVHGDTTTTLGGALASYYQKIPVGHVEAGLRTHDIYQPFPEEINRRLTDALCTLYFSPTEESQKNLIRENIKKDHVFVTGNTVIDAFFSISKEKRPFENKELRKLISKIKKCGKGIVLMTAHRRENFGAPFLRVLNGVKDLSLLFPSFHWIYPVHPNPNVFRPAHQVLSGFPNIHLVPPLSYADLVGVMNLSHVVVTDSGGLQEEAPSIGKPVLVLREVTERPEAVRAGTVKLVGTNQEKLIREFSRLLTQPAHYEKMSNAVNPYGDGQAAQRIVQALLWYFGRSRSKPRPFRYDRTQKI